MGIILKIALAIFFVFYVKSCVTKTTLEHLPDSIPIEMKNISIKELNIGKQVSSEKSQKSDSTDRIVLQPQSFHPRLTECEDVHSAHGKSLISHASDVTNMERPRLWTVKNQSNLTLAIVIIQNNQKVAVAFVDPDGIYRAKIPSSELDFFVKYSKNTCVNWRQAGGVKFSTTDFESNPYENFSSVVSNAQESISIQNSLD